MLLSQKCFKSIYKALCVYVCLCVCLSAHNSGMAATNVYQFSGLLHDAPVMQKVQVGVLIRGQKIGIFYIMAPTGQVPGEWPKPITLSSALQA